MSKPEGQLSEMSRRINASLRRAGPKENKKIMPEILTRKPTEQELERTREQDGEAAKYCVSLR